MTGFWAIDEKPTGSKDPFALRRAALGVIRLVVGNGVRMSLFDVQLLAIAKKLAPPIDWMGWLAYSIETAEEETISYIDGELAHDSPFGRFVMSGLSSDDNGLNTHDCVVAWLMAHKLTRPTSLQQVEVAIGGTLEDPERALDAINSWFDRNDEATSMEDLDYSISSIARNPVLSVHSGTDISSYTATVSTDLLAFIHDRLKVYLRDQGIRHDIIDACLAMPGNDDLTLLVKRAEALALMLKSEDGANLLSGFKRANNILTAEEKKDGVEYSLDPDVKFAEGPEERALFAALDRAEEVIAPAIAAEDFGAAMTAMAALRGPVDAFFTAVQVNADSQIIRRNRLCLLHRIREICGQVADLARIEG